nr:CinA family protein [Dehalococcoidia bacterium]
MEEIRPHIEKIHVTPHKTVLAVSGAGTQAVAWLLGVAGASRTILEALVPYGRESMNAFLGFEPEQSASAQTAKDMAKAAFRKAKVQLEDDSPPVGLACAATIATDRPKRGEHRAYVSAWDQQGNTLYSLNLHKG